MKKQWNKLNLKQQQFIVFVLWMSLGFAFLGMIWGIGSIMVIIGGILSIAMIVTLFISGFKLINSKKLSHTLFKNALAKEIS